METSNWFTSTNWNVHVLNLKWLSMLHPTHCLSSPEKKHMRSKSFCESSSSSLCRRWPYSTLFRKNNTCNISRWPSHYWLKPMALAVATFRQKNKTIFCNVSPFGVQGTLEALKVWMAIAIWYMFEAWNHIHPKRKKYHALNKNKCYQKEHLSNFAITPPPPDLEKTGSISLYSP